MELKKSGCAVGVVVGVVGVVVDGLWTGALTDGVLPLGSFGNLKVPVLVSVKLDQDVSVASVKPMGFAFSSIVSVEPSSDVKV